LICHQWVWREDAPRKEAYELPYSRIEDHAKAIRRVQIFGHVTKRSSGTTPPGGRLVKVNLERSKTYEGHTIGSGPWTCHRGGHGKADTEGSKVLA